MAKLPLIFCTWDLNSSKQLDNRGVAKFPRQKILLTLIYWIFNKLELSDNIGAANMIMAVPKKNILGVIWEGLSKW